jgi:hypothetical protein
MAAKVCSTGVKGIEAHPVGVEANPGTDIGFLDSRDMAAECIARSP